MSDIRLQPSEKGRTLANTWISQNERIEQLKGQLDKAQDAADLTAKELADWLRPKDAKDLEVFHMWVGSTLLAICNNSVTVRTKE